MFLALLHSVTFSFLWVQLVKVAFHAMISILFPVFSLHAFVVIFPLSVFLQILAEVRQAFYGGELYGIVLRLLRLAQVDEPSVLSRSVFGVQPH